MPVTSSDNTGAPIEQLPVEIISNILRFLKPREIGFFAETSTRNAWASTNSLKIAAVKLSKLFLCEGSLYWQVANQLYACGKNDYGQLGLGDTNHIDKLKAVGGYSGKISRVFLFYEMLFVLSSDGLWACGDNQFGSLGLGENKLYTELHRVTGLDDDLLGIVNYSSRIFVWSRHKMWQSGVMPLRNEDEEIAAENLFFTLMIENIGEIQEVVFGNNQLFIRTLDSLWAYALEHLDDFSEPDGNSDSEAELQDDATAFSTTNSTADIKKLHTFKGAFKEMAVKELMLYVLTDQGLWQHSSAGYGSAGSGLEGTKISGFAPVENYEGVAIKVFPFEYCTFLLTSTGLAVTGDNSQGQLGLGDLDNHFSFTTIPGFTNDVLNIHSTQTINYIMTSTDVYAAGTVKNTQEQHKSWQRIAALENREPQHFIAIIDEDGAENAFLIVCGKSIWLCENDFKARLILAGENKLLKVVADATNLYFLTEHGSIFQYENYRSATATPEAIRNISPLVQAEPTNSASPKPMHI